MPEYVLPTDNAPASYDALDDVAKGFIEALFFCEVSCYPASEFFTPKAQRRIEEGQADGNIPSDSGVEHLTDDAITKIAAFCQKFTTSHADLVALACEREGYDLDRVGNDLYFTHAGHGIGFWDRDALKAEGLGDRLTEAAGRGEVYLFAEGDAEGFTLGVDLY